MVRGEIAGEASGTLLADRFVLIGNDSVVGDINSLNTVLFRDRSTAHNVTTAKNVQLGSSDHITQVIPGAYQRYDQFTLSVPYTAPNSSLVIGSSQSLAPGAYGNVILQGNATLTLGDGLYVFQTFLTNTGSFVKTTGTRTWIYVMSGGSVVTLRSTFSGPASGLFIGAPNAGFVNVGNTFFGTIVAPNADTEIDMVNGATFTGSVFSHDFRLHQGQFFFHSSFSGNWIPTCTSGGGFQSCN